MASKSSKIPSKSTVDYVADPRSCNSFNSIKIYVFFETWPTVDSKKKNPTTVDSWSTFKKKSRNSRFIVKSRLSTSRLGAHCHALPHTLPHALSHTAALPHCCTATHCQWTAAHYRSHCCSRALPRTAAHCHSLPHNAAPYCRMVAHCRSHCHMLPPRVLPPTHQALKLPFKMAFDKQFDFFRESWPYCRLWFQKLTNCRQSRFQKKIATVATSRQTIFRGFCCGFFIGFQWENGRIRTK
jgi:hypothetical protein